MDMNTIIYSLNVRDIQHVAMEELGREMTDEEIEKLVDMIAGRIPWYDAISNALDELLYDYKD